MSSTVASAVIDKLLLAIRDSRGVPASERSVASVLGALDSSNEGKHAVVGHIIEDFALTQKVLQLANSSMYAPFGAGSASVSSAIDVLGSDAVLHLVLGAELISEEDLQQDDNLSRTLLASELARSACAERAEDASIATLMVEIGRLMTGKYLPGEAAAIAARMRAGQALQEAASAVLGMSYQELGVELAARWNLPETLRTVIDGTGDPTLVGIARFASAASSLIHEGQAEAVNTLLRNLDLPGIDKSHLGALVGRKMEAARPLPGSPPVASLEASLQVRQQRMQEKVGSLEELASAMLPGLAEALKTSHCLLFMLTRSGEQRVRHGYGRGLDELRSRLKISADFLPTAFHAAIRKNIDVSIADVAKLKDASLPEGYRALLPQVTRFIILPIATSRVSGLLYCDWDTEGTLNQSEIEALKKLRNLFLPFFPQ
jgi:HD-like signal output (HDOD) protein